MFITRKHLSRRAMLKGAGVALGLPFLEAMVPAATALAQTAAAPRLRAGFFYIPHGAVQGDTKLGPAGDQWTPSGSGPNFKLNEITSPLEPYKKYVSTVGNLNNPAGAGVHTKNPGTWLNCTTPPSTTIDQLMARQFGQDTPVRSLEVASETTIGPRAGNGTVTGRTLCFRDENTPLEMEYNPKKIYSTLFFGADRGPETYARLQETNSLLDLIKENTQTLQRDLGSADKAVLEKYLDDVREVEQQTREREAKAKPLLNLKLIPPPAGVLDEFDKQVALIFDLIALAYQGNITRVASFFMAQEGTNRTYNFIGVPDSFHPLSHHANEPAKIEKLVKIQKWHMTKFAEFLKKMAETADGDGSLLDHSIFLYGSNMGNSDKHSNWPLPTVVAGGGNGRMKLGGQHIAPAQQMPLSNVHLTLLNKAGVAQTRFADSTGMIAEL